MHTTLALGIELDNQLHDQSHDQLHDQLKHTGTHTTLDEPLLPIELALDTPLEKWVQLFVDHLAAQSLVSESTINHYTHDLWLMLRYLITFKPDAMSPQAIDQPTILDFIKHMSEIRSNRPASVRRRVASINRFFQFLVSQGVIDENPVDGIEKIRERPRRPVVLTRSECNRILEAAKTTSQPTRDYAIFKLFLSCGCTLSELLGLDVNDFDPDEKTISFVGRDGYRRTVSLPPDCYKALIDYFEVRPKAPADRALFVNRHGQRITKGAVYHAFRLILVRARIERKDVTIHTLRHTCLTMMWQDGAGIFQLQQIAGHASLSTTRKYTRILRRQVTPGGSQRFRIVSRLRS